jgi:hypothetical protein
MAMRTSSGKNAGARRQLKSRRPNRYARRLSVERLEARQMLDGAAALLGVPPAEGEAAAMPDFSLIDMNSTSPTYQQSVSPRDYLGHVTGWYLGAALCGYCVDQFHFLDQMQLELRATYPLLRIELIGINEPDQQAGNTAATGGTDIPWLQDLDIDENGLADAAMDLWGMEFRDVVILDGASQMVGTYNLNQHDLANSDNYDTLQHMLIDAAMSDQKPWQNPVNPRDVNDDGRVAPLDVLWIVNQLNQSGSHLLPPPTSNNAPPPFWDTNGDGSLTPSDALLVINFLNSRGGVSQAEGESWAMDAAVNDRPASEPQVEHPFRTDALVTRSWGSEPAAQSPAPDDAARSSAIDRILAEEASDELRTIGGQQPESDWPEL